MALECEAKLKVPDLECIRAKLDKLGATNEGGCLERNWVLDDAEGSLRRSGKLLRVRSLGGDEAVLTVKLPVAGGAFKSREEIETMVDSSGDLLRQLGVLGFKAIWIYEKFRQTWLWRDCVLALDECPEMGYFVEIEGAPERIRAVAGELGLDPAAHIPDTYLGLWTKHLAVLGQPLRDMVFSGGTTARRNRSSITTRVGIGRRVPEREAKRESEEEY